MLQDPPLFPNRILEAALQPISRPNVNFARSGPLALHTSRTTGISDFHTHGLGQRQSHFTDSENKVREETPLLTPTPTPTSINWWPYPPWGQSAVSSTPSATATPVASSSVATAAAVASLTPASTIPLSATTSSATHTAGISIPTLPPTDSLPSNPRVHTAASSHFNMLYLVPVFVAVGLALGALSGLLGYRWYSRRLARKGGPSNGILTRGRAGSSPVPGPPYIPMLDASHDSEGAQETSSSTSPSKYTRHGAPRSARSWLSSVAGAGSRPGSTHSSSIPPSQRSTTRAHMPSHLLPLSDGPTRARSRGSTISPVSLSDEENVPYESIRHTSIRRGILERLQLGTVSRAPSRRTTQTYLSVPSAYSGTHTEDSRAPSAAPSSSTSHPHNTTTDWIPGSGFRIVEEAILSPPASGISSPASGSVTGLPGPTTTSAWDDRAAIRQAVDAHPGERWLAWTRSWASSPPQQDRFTAPPARRRLTAPPQEKPDDVGAALPRSPPQLTSGSLQSTLTFALAVPRAATTTTGRRARARQAQSQPLPVRQAAVRGDSRASSIVLGEGHGTPAMRYAARQTALARVEDILARSYSSRDLAEVAASPSSPSAFGAAAESSTVLASTTEEDEEEDFGSAPGIVQRLAVAEASATATNRRRLR